MDQIWLSNNRRQIVHNVYCPNVNDAIAICEIELKQLDQEHSNYLEVPFEQYKSQWWQKESTLDAPCIWSTCS